MASKRQFSYQWKLFIPLVATLWLVIVLMAAWQQYYLRQNSLEQIRSQLALVNARIIAAYEEDIDPADFLRFVKRYYIENPLYDQVRISAYYQGELIYNVGRVIMLSDNARRSKAGLTSIDNPDLLEEDREERNFYYNIGESKDKKLLVYTMLPFDSTVRDAMYPSDNVYVIVFGMALVATFFAYFYTRNVGRNIRMLRDFARRATCDPDFVPSMDYPHDELGDISRQIVQFYNERTKAMLRLKREHAIAIHSTEEKSRIKRELTNNINHELKTPVGVIKGYVDTILEHPDMDSASRDHFMKKISEHVERLVNLMNDLSMMTRLEAGGNMISTEELDYHDVVFNAVSEFEESGMLGSIEFNYDMPFDCKVRGNYNLLFAMLGNLTRNAVAYSRGTEINLVLTGEDDKFYYFSFYDNGVGVKDESIPHLFERFYREDAGRSRKTGGTGLGLPIVMNTVVAHGGTITVANRDGGGLIFKYSLRKAK